MTKETFLYGYGPLSAIKEEAKLISEVPNSDEEAKYDFFNEQDQEGRIDVLNEVLSNVEDWNDKEDIFYYVQGHVNFRGKLEKGFDFDKSVCAIDAAHFGNLHIIQWLREVKGLELDGELCCSAIEGVKEGNLDILQWLHTEGCPWPDNIWYRVHEDEIEPEALAWLRANGYGDKYAHKQESPTATSLSA